MNNVVYVRPQAQHRLSTLGLESDAQILRSAVLRLLAQARAEGMENTILSLELTLTAIDVDVEDISSRALRAAE